MQAEFTARHTSWTKKLKAVAEEGLDKLERVLGENCTAKVVVTEEKQRKIAEVSVSRRDKKFLAREEGFDMAAALQSAFAKVETQAQKQRARTRSRKRVPAEAKQATTQTAPRGAKRTRPLLEENAPAPVRSSSGKTRTLPVVTHSFPAARPLPEPHIVRSPELVAHKPMTLEEAVKEAEFRDREVFVFRTGKGDVNVLYRQRDGRMALIEAL